MSSENILMSSKKNSHKSPIAEEYLDWFLNVVVKRKLLNCSDEILEGNPVEFLEEFIKNLFLRS